MSVATGPGQIAALAHTHGSNLIFDLAGDNLGGVWVVIGRLLYVTSVLAALIAFHNTTARYAFSLGRERLLPSALGTTSQRTSSPRLGSLAQSAVAGTVIVIYGLAGGHPVRDLFFIWTASGSLGILMLIATTSVAIVVFFAREDTGESAWRRVVAPVLAAAGCLTAVVLVLANFDKMLEVDDSSPLRWGVPGVYLVIAVLGVLWGVRLRGRRPDIYATIGLGAKSAAGTGLGMLTDEGTTRRLR
ncbi:APC family permease [Allokutzneria albata]|uniref:APC family permease n=1 Tax=Allokutzneria albata TaxID=211114 RepID=UPI0018D2FD96|nr:APC family permease [Allokutzneria albata]